MRVLILGGGQIANAVAATAPMRHDVEARSHAELDIVDESDVLREVSKCKAHWIINAAAFTAVDLAEERAEIESGLRSGALRGVVSTNALELGIDVGALDVAVIAGYPGSSMSFWQQAGRVPHRLVLGRLAAVAQRHLPAGEGGHDRAEFRVHLRQRGRACRRHLGNGMPYPWKLCPRNSSRLS